MKQTRRIIASALAITVMSSIAACGPTQVNSGNGPKDEDKSVSYLYVSTRDTGVKKQWLDNFARGFEAKYANTSFEEGKLGVRVETEASNNNSGSRLLANIASSMYSVSMVENLHYVDFMANDLLYDISGLVNQELDDGTGTIRSKISAEQSAYLTGFNGKYYAAPWFSGFNGVTYDSALFEEKNLYFADANGYKPFAKSTYTDTEYTGRGFITAANLTKSCGPDGEKGTFDDGLPSSYEEFFYLLEYMREMKGVDPFIYTGASYHYLNYMFQALVLNWSGAQDVSYAFSFDSGEDTASIVTGFEGNTPIIEEVKITTENGYLTTQLAGKYYATKFMTELFENETRYFYSLSSNTSFSNIDAQTIFINSRLNSAYAPVAMLIEGAYWYNESTSALESSVTKYGEEAKNREFCYMPMPGQEKGTVEDGKGKSIVLGDGLANYMIINNNVKNNPVKKQLAELFFKYCYEEANLQSFTLTTGLPVAVDYELTEEQYDSTCNYWKSLWDVYSTALKNNSYCTTVGGNKIFLANRPTFAFNTASGFCTSTVNAIKYEDVRAGVKAKLSAKDYFLGLKVSESKWAEFNIYN